MAILKESVKALIANTLNVSIDRVHDELAIGDIPEWDSLAHAYYHGSRS